MVGGMQALCLTVAQNGGLCEDLGIMGIMGIS